MPANSSPLQKALAVADLYRRAFAEMYGGIFTATAVVCAVGAVLGLLLSRRDVHADEPAIVVQREPLEPRV